MAAWKTTNRSLGNLSLHAATLLLHALAHARCELECDPKAKCICATVLCGPLEALDQNTSVDFNDSAGSDVVGVGRDLDVSQPFSASMLQHQFQRAPGVTAARLPRHDRIANVSEDVSRQL